MDLWRPSKQSTDSGNIQPIRFIKIAEFLSVVIAFSQIQFEFHFYLCYLLCFDTNKHVIKKLYAIWFVESSSQSIKIGSKAEFSGNVRLGVIGQRLEGVVNLGSAPPLGLRVELTTLLSHRMVCTWEGTWFYSPHCPFSIQLKGKLPVSEQLPKFPSHTAFIPESCLLFLTPTLGKGTAVGLKKSEFGLKFL